MRLGQTACHVYVCTYDVYVKTRGWVRPGLNLDQLSSDLCCGQAYTLVTDNIFVFYLGSGVSHCVDVVLVHCSSGVGCCSRHSCWDHE